MGILGTFRIHFSSILHLIHIFRSLTQNNPWILFFISVYIFDTLKLPLTLGSGVINEAES
jgi:hypothetical protein